MAVRIRLKLLGRKKKPFFRVVAIDSKTRREGAELERLGWYDPLKSENSFNLKEDRIKHWIAVGAVTSHAVKGVFKKAGLSYKWHLEKEGKSENEIEQLLEEWHQRKAKQKTKSVEIPVDEELDEGSSKNMDDESIEVSAEDGDVKADDSEETPIVEDSAVEESSEEESADDDSQMDTSDSENSDEKLEDEQIDGNDSNDEKKVEKVEETS